MWHIDLDMAYDEATASDALERIATETRAMGLRIDSTIVDEHGPGGGWPIVRWQSESLTDLAIFLERYYDQDQAPELIAFAVAT